MITTGVITEINVSGGSSTNNIYKVNIPIFNNPSNTNAGGSVLECTASLPGGVYSSYKVGDMVYVGFVNNQLQSPVILGRIYKGLTEETRSYLRVESLKVDGSVSLPKTVTIGDLSYADLVKATNGSGGTFVRPNPPNPTEVLQSIEIDGIGYSVKGAGENQVQSDWGQSDSLKVDYIKNKPSKSVVELETLKINW